MEDGTNHTMRDMRAGTRNKPTLVRKVGHLYSPGYLLYRHSSKDRTRGYEPQDPRSSRGDGTTL